MKILVTVGTTLFDSLIKVVDSISLEYRNLDIISQIGPGSFEPRYHPFFEYQTDIFTRYMDRFVITHCGAGSVYQLLEHGRKFIAVPNLERIDVHQRELAEYLKEENLALVCMHPKEIIDVIATEDWFNFSPNPYKKDAFFVGNEIKSIVDRFKPTDK